MCWGEHRRSLQRLYGASLALVAACPADQARVPVILITLRTAHRSAVEVADDAQALEGEVDVDVVIVSHNGAIMGASPPVATTGVSSPSSTHTRRTRPSTIAASPSIRPACTLSRVLVPMTRAGWLEVDLRQPRGLGEQRLGARLDPRGDRAAQVRAVGCDDVDRGRGAEVDDDDRAAERLERRDAVDDAVGADLVRVVVADRHAGLQPGSAPRAPRHAHASRDRPPTRRSAAGPRRRGRPRRRRPTRAPSSRAAARRRLTRSSSAVSDALRRDAPVARQSCSASNSPSTVCVLPTSTASSTGHVALLGRTRRGDGTVTRAAKRRRHRCYHRRWSPRVEATAHPYFSCHDTRRIIRRRVHERVPRSHPRRRRRAIHHRVRLATTSRRRATRSTVAADGDEALELAARHHFDLVVLDVMLPGMDGYEVCRRLRATLLECPCCSCRRATPSSTRSSGSRSAATTTSPSRSASASCWRASRRCCAARSRASREASVGRRAVRGRPASRSTRARTRRTRRHGLDLTPREFELLACLMRHAGKVLSREQLLREAWGWEYPRRDQDGRHPRQAAARQARGRRRRSRLVETVRGYGYRFRAA